MNRANTRQVAEQFPHAVRVLRCRHSHRYFTGEGWTHDPGLAAHFKDELEAARACVTNGLHGVELVLRTATTGIELFSTPVR